MKLGTFNKYIIPILALLTLNSCSPPIYTSVVNTEKLEINIKAYQKFWEKSQPLYLTVETLVNCFQQMQALVPKGKRYGYFAKGGVDFTFTDIYLSDDKLHELCLKLQEPLANLKSNEEIVYKYGNFLGNVLAMLNKDLGGSKIHEDPNEIIVLISHTGGYSGSLAKTREGLTKATGNVGRSVLYCWFDSKGKLLSWKTTGPGWRIE